MTPEQIRIAVAEEMGWTKIHDETDRNPDNDRMSYLAGRPPKHHSLDLPKWAYLNEIPELTLDWMHEAYLSLSEGPDWFSSQKAAFGNRLFDIVARDEGLAHFSGVPLAMALKAAAKQWAEAFLIVRGKWPLTPAAAQSKS